MYNAYEEAQTATNNNVDGMSYENVAVVVVAVVGITLSSVLG